MKKEEEEEIVCEQPNVDIVGGEARQNVLAFHGHRSDSMGFHGLNDNLIGSGILLCSEWFLWGSLLFLALLSCNYPVSFRPNSGWFSQLLLAE